MEEFYAELIKTIKGKSPTSKELNRIKNRLVKKYSMKKIPTNADILLNANPEDLKDLKIITKPTRTLSGVAPIALMCKPHKCPHGTCIYCPGGPGSEFGDVPQSYTGNEPSTMRSMRNNYDPYFVVFNRLEQYVILNQNSDKVEIIIQGGTFLSLDKEYKDEFVMYIFKALNDFSDMFFKKGVLEFNKFRDFFELPGDIYNPKRKVLIHKKLAKLKLNSDLVTEQLRNETSKIRCVGLTIETKPDWGLLNQSLEMLKYGCTRVELGAQSTDDKIQKITNRGHGIRETIDSTRILKDLGFKINYHMMPGLPLSNPKKDLEMLKETIDNPDYRPDMFKIYPTMVMKGTGLFQLYKTGKYKSLERESAADIISDFMGYVPYWIRIMRVQRDIPTKVTEAGVDKTNLRQYVDALMKKHEKEAKVKGKNKCRCIRCREAGHVFRKFKQIPDQKNVKLIVRGYEASEGVEWFISFEDTKQDILLGFCRLRLPARDLVDIKNKKEITNNIAFIRELHVVGEAIEIGATKIKGKKPKLNIQHKGLGKQLIKEAENIAKQFCKKKMIVISGIGARDYYRKLGYKKEGVYMVKTIK